MCPLKPSYCIFQYLHGAKIFDLFLWLQFILRYRLLSVDLNIEESKILSKAIYDIPIFKV